MAHMLLPEPTKFGNTMVLFVFFGQLRYIVFVGLGIASQAKQIFLVQGLVGFGLKPKPSTLNPTWRVRGALASVLEQP